MAVVYRISHFLCDRLYKCGRRNLHDRQLVVPAGLFVVSGSVFGKQTKNLTPADQPYYC